MERINFNVKASIDALKHYAKVELSKLLQTYLGNVRSVQRNAEYQIGYLFLDSPL